MAKEVVLTVDKSGQVGVEAFGFEGGSCKQATEFLEKALGSVVSVKNKQEMFLVSTAGGVSNQVGV